MDAQDTRTVSAPLGFGLVGTGMIAGYHAQALAQVSGATLIGVAGRSPDKVGAFARQHQVPFATTHLAELLSRPDIRVVCITTPSGAHLEPALAAIAAGKHVVIEKPLEVTTDRIDRIITAADRAGVRIIPIFQARFGAGAQAIKAALEAGRFGRLVLCSADVKWHRPASYYQGWKGTRTLDGGGAVMNQAIHGLDLLQWFAGLPAEVRALTGRRVHAGIQSEDTACASLRFPDGALGTITASTAVWPGWARRLEICGEHGSVALEDDRIVRWEFREPRPEDEAIIAGSRTSSLGSGASDPRSISTEGHRRQLQDLVDALREHRAPAIEGREGRKAVALVNALYASAESGRPVAP